ncbi:glutamine--fructose-6-phosphate transaminase (isomerizing) [Paenibacillus wynnii]|uniref:glutamine--fructose-6-phosphate transaminase (isomerizing) n=1 Tax=Paenibacillus wynnii TaxID=268407 RepID=UPI00278F0EF5|nr:glutamine--fructose-6-phosphate transaminase (isomerizing) [Paenibacillus wynnii]MDQ0193929.1 glucosamine--fructose-6-phosphate aminotransferase (isomerizing) [Paenibacillus wynnii]
MCGIVGYIGDGQAQQILTNGLKKLEYRGYDSAGIAVYNGEEVQVCKSKGRIAVLEERLEHTPMEGSVGIGHTRWATHGRPSDENSHPHTDESGKFSVVHNGIIENYQELKQDLLDKGVIFTSETDTEVIVHLLADLYDGDIISTVQTAVSKMRGAYSLGVITEYEPDKLIAVRFASPLVIGLGERENFIGSDISAVLEYTRDFYILEDGEMAVITRSNVSLMKMDTNQAVQRDILRVDWDMVQTEKDGFETFMLKEIYEQPNAFRKTILNRIDSAGKNIVFEGLNLSAELIQDLDKIYIIGCGTAFHAGLVGKYVIEELTRIPVEVDVASEFRYRRPIITKKTLVIVVSQSGETADTLAALRESQRLGAKVLAITNAPGSSIARDADDVIATIAGPEIAVASTKAYSSQLIVFYLLGLYLAQVKDTILGDERKLMIEALCKLPEQAEAVLQRANDIQLYAESIKDRKSLFFMGRGIDYAVALEGSLKLKEISYIHSEAYAAGELKHGTLALIEEGTPVIALVTQTELYEKMVSNIKEVKARGAHVLGVTLEENIELHRVVDDVCLIPHTLPLFTPILSVLPLQLIAYYASRSLGNDVDKPRNLAKSVTVE